MQARRVSELGRELLETATERCRNDRSAPTKFRP